MDWYLGSVNDAIKHCLEQKALLIVYIHHPESENNNSTVHFNSLWENFDNSSIVQLNYVALKLEHNSEGSKQFAAIFPTPIVPACYVIGLGGKPLEIITTVEELTLEKLNASVKKAAELYEQQFVEFLSKPSSPPSATSDDANAAAAVSSEDVPQTDSQGQEIPLEDRVLLARQKIAEKRKLDEEKKKQEEHEKELRRIKEGKLMQESKERSKENEIREAAEERRKQKQADQETLRRLREQIRLDKEARAQKASGGVSKEPEEEKPSTAAEPVINKPVATDECRIQCKFPDGSTLIKQFKSDSPLQVVIDAVKEDGRMPGEFFLVQTYPRKQLTEYDKSLLDHGLTPASALLVVSGTLLSGPPGGGIVSTTSGYLSFFIGLLYSPIMAIYQFMLSLIGMGPSTTKRDPQKPGSSNSSNPRDAEQSTSSELRRRRAGNNENRNLVRMEGNTARLRNPDDSSDDEKATWNGNSTQQL